MDNLTTDWIDAATAQLNAQKLNKDQDNAIVNLFEICAENPSRAFNVICEILETNPRKDVLGYLGAGPLEDLLLKNCEYIDIAIERTKNITLLKECLAHVNLDKEDCPNSQTLYDFLE